MLDAGEGASADLELSVEERERLHDALKAAFPGKDLHKLVRLKLGQNMDDIGADAFDLIGWAEAQGRVTELILGAEDRNPGNPKLVALARDLRAEGRLPPPEPRSENDPSPAPPKEAEPASERESRKGAAASNQTAILVGAFAAVVLGLVAWNYMVHDPDPSPPTDPSSSQPAATTAPLPGTTPTPGSGTVPGPVPTPHPNIPGPIPPNPIKPPTPGTAPGPTTTTPAPTIALPGLEPPSALGLMIKRLHVVEIACATKKKRPCGGFGVADALVVTADVCLADSDGCTISVSRVGGMNSCKASKHTAGLNKASLTSGIALLELADGCSTSRLKLAGAAPAKGPAYTWALDKSHGAKLEKGVLSLTSDLTLALGQGTVVNAIGMPIVDDKGVVLGMVTESSSDKGYQHGPSVEQLRAFLTDAGLTL